MSNINENNIRYLNDGEPHNQVVYNRPIEDLVDEVKETFDKKAESTLTLTAGDGLNGGGNLTANRTFSLTNIAAGSTAQGAVYYNGTSISPGRFYGGTTNPSDTTRLNYDGHLHVNNLVAVGDVNSSSDERLKENWREVNPNLVEGLSNLKYGVYDRTDIKATQVGVSAQSLIEILPEAVSENEDGMLSVAYGNAALVGLIELTKYVKQLEEKIKILEGK